MRKKNRIMLKAVAILLCLVLFTTCIVSSTFARFANRQTATTNMTLGSFGVELEMTYKTSWEGKNVTITPTKNGDSLSVTISGLRMIPGDDFPEIVRFKFVEGKTPNVPVTVTITQTLSHDYNNFRVNSNGATDNSVGNLKKDKFAMPLGFKFAAYDNDNNPVIEPGYIVNPWRLGKYSRDEYINPELATALTNKIVGVSRPKDTTDCVTASFNPDDFGDEKLTGIKFKANGNSTADINQLVFGVHWPEIYESTEYNDTEHLLTGATALDYSAMETWLCSQGKNLAVSITYTVKIEQD